MDLYRILEYSCFHVRRLSLADISDFWIAGIGQRLNWNLDKLQSEDQQQLGVEACELSSLYVECERPSDTSCAMAGAR